jgi:hypothetical protein
MSSAEFDKDTGGNRHAVCFPFPLTRIPTEGGNCRGQWSLVSIFDSPHTWRIKGDAGKQGRKMSCSRPAD